MKPLLACNWKTYISTEEDARNLAKSFSVSEKAEMVVCPSSLHIASVREILKEKNICIGAQDISVSSEKPQTGRLSGRQLHDMGVEYVLVGHAETRAVGVTNKTVAQKAGHAMASGIKPIVCLSEQNNDEQNAGDEVVAQLEEIIKINGNVCGMIIAYEPTAYIGADTALDVMTAKSILARLHRVIMHCGGSLVLYGGSVDAGNIADILRHSGANGFLIGRAGSDAEKINAILSAL